MKLQNVRRKAANAVQNSYDLAHNAGDAAPDRRLDLRIPPPLHLLPPPRQTPPGRSPRRTPHQNRRPRRPLHRLGPRHRRQVRPPHRHHRPEARPKPVKHLQAGPCPPHPQPRMAAAGPAHDRPHCRAPPAPVWEPGPPGARGRQAASGSSSPGPAGVPNSIQPSKTARHRAPLSKRAASSRPASHRPTLSFPLRRSTPPEGRNPSPFSKTGRRAAPQTLQPPQR